MEFLSIYPSTTVPDIAIYEPKSEVISGNESKLLGIDESATSDDQHDLIVKRPMVGRNIFGRPWTITEPNSFQAHADQVITDTTFKRVVDQMRPEPNIPRVEDHMVGISDILNRTPTLPLRNRHIPIPLPPTDNIDILNTKYQSPIPPLRNIRSTSPQQLDDAQRIPI